ncbi:peptidase inhibitor family I36 protein [Streptomyces sp. NPDC000594]|uniref:peptidase inhibitor family I36 protein n=1 Tax=Streptomyces sp. NPDC000594 TaxID=3154261 RepID=UPI00331EC29B
MPFRPKKPPTLLAAPAVVALTLSAALTGTVAAASSTPAVSVARTGNLICVHAHFNDCGNAPLSVRDPARDIAVDPRWQDSISSIRNRTGSTMCFWEHNNHEGRHFRVPNGYEVGNLGGNVFNDAISSWKPC